MPVLIRISYYCCFGDEEGAVSPGRAGILMHDVLSFQPSTGAGALQS